jgi:nicotinamidase-related amidase
MAKKKGHVKKIILSVVGVIVAFILTLIINLIIFEKNASKISKGIPIEQSEVAHPALLVIDVQEATTGTVSFNQHYVDKSEKFIDNINKAARFFNEHNLPIIYIRSEITNPLINLLNNSYAKGSIGSKFDKRLEMKTNNEVVKKRNDAFANTNLDKILIANNINELFIAGLDAAHCINITTQAAQNRKYKISIIKEAVLSESTAMRDSMYIEFEKRGMELINIKKLDSEIKHDKY